MLKRDFTAALEWLVKQRKAENAEVERSKAKSGKKPSSGKMKYLGK